MNSPNFNNRSTDLPTMSTHLQRIYNDQAKRNKLFDKNQKNMYYKIISQQQNQRQQLKNRQRYLNQLENSQINHFWQKQQQKRVQMQKERKKKLYENNQVNKIMTQNLPTHKIQNNYQINQDYDAYGALLDKQRQKIKQQKDNVRLQNLYQRDFQMMMNKINKQQDTQLTNKKNQQLRDFYRKREQQLQKRKDRHVQNKSAFDNYDLIEKKKKIQSQLLEDYIVNKGANQMQDRMFKLQLEQAERANTIRNKFISELKSQVQDDQIRNFQDRKRINQSQRKIMEDRYKYMMDLQQQRKRRKSLQNKKHLQVLNSQLKTRNLIPQKQPIEDAGIGSPVHIGKYMNDDRKRQLQWIQRSLQRQLLMQ